MKVLVCGGRDFSDRVLMGNVLKSLHLDWGLGTIIEGDCSGADRLAGEWARHNGVKNQKFPADWQKYGRAAGPMRNQKMLDEGQPDLVVAFPGGKGTADMIDRSRRNGFQVMEIAP